jgi:aquaporin Z
MVVCFGIIRSNDPANLSLFICGGTAVDVLRRHYPEYLIEAAGLGIFMVMAAVVTTLLKHPASPIHPITVNPLLQRLIIGIIMGLTAIALIYSPWGKQSGAHFNPVVTVTFFRLGKIKPWDMVFYIVAQFMGGLFGILFAAKILQGAIAHPSIHYIVTTPISGRTAIAFFAEFIIAFGMMLMVLLVSNTPKLAQRTGIFAGILIAIYITVEAPLSGMSMNPARTLASAILAQTWTSLWIYFTAPLAGMMLAAEVYSRRKGRQSVRCAKLHHQNNKRCIFRCGYREHGMGEAMQLSDRLPTLRH